VCVIDNCVVETFLDQLLHMPSVKAPAKKGIRYHVAGEVLEYSDLRSLAGSRWLNDKVCIARAVCKWKREFSACLSVFSCCTEVACG